jgi:hypothetical protein
MTVLRIQGGVRRGDTGALLVLGLDRGVMRLRSVCRGGARIPRRVYDRIGEGGDVTFAMLGLRDGVPAVALVAGRHAEPCKPETFMVVDADSWRHGLDGTGCPTSSGGCLAGRARDCGAGMEELPGGRMRRPGVRAGRGWRQDTSAMGAKTDQLT